MNLKLAIRVGRLIFLDVFQKGLIYHYFFTAFCIEKGKQVGSCSV